MLIWRVLRLRPAMTPPEHEARGADQLSTNAIDVHLRGEQSKDDDDEDGSAGVLVPAG